MSYLEAIFVYWQSNTKITKLRWVYMFKMHC